MDFKKIFQILRKYILEFVLETFLEKEIIFLKFHILLLLYIYIYISYAGNAGDTPVRDSRQLVYKSTGTNTTLEILQDVVMAMVMVILSRHSHLMS